LVVVNRLSTLGLLSFNSIALQPRSSAERMHVPKEIWLLVDHLLHHGMDTVPSCRCAFVAPPTCVV
jgi:hypothetical protein